jgi:hypothetical protein
MVIVLCLNRRPGLQTCLADMQDYTQAYRQVLTGTPIIRVTGE